MTTQASYLHRLWQQGEQHLVARHYVLARRELERAEAIAWRDADAASLARIYLPLLEARRQIRYHAVEGDIIICGMGISEEESQLAAFLQKPAGTILLACAADGGKPTRRRSANAGETAACRFAGSVQYEAQRTGHWIEALLLVTSGNEMRIATQADPTFAAGLPVQFTAETGPPLGESTDPNLVIPLPATGHYQGNTPGPGAVARESLLVAWEALALHWQRRHPPPRAASRNADPRQSGWEEMAWLRLALRIDPACEPITMRLIALAEAIERL